MSNDEKEFFLMLHGWRFRMKDTRKAYFPPNGVIGTYDLNDAYRSATEALNGKLISFLDADMAA